MNSEAETVDFLRALCRMTGRMSMLELGTYNGYTARALARLGGLVMSVDIKDQRHYFTDNERAYDFILGDSRTFVYGQRGFDFVFFDSVHTFEHVEAEFNHVRPALMRGAILAFHDPVSFPEVGRFVKTCEHIRQIILPTTIEPGRKQSGLAIATLI